jgi:3-dehydro-4-phosphotetronate decarboxylase
VTESQAREEICRVGASLFARGYVHATAGNISTRLAPEQGGGFLITPTDACLGFLDPAQLARIGDDGAQVGGARTNNTARLKKPS